MQVNGGNAASKQMSLRTQMSNLTHEPGQSIEELAATLYGIVKQLRASGAIVPTREMNQWLLKSLGADYSAQVSQALVNEELMNDTLLLIAFLQQREVALKSFRPGVKTPAARYADHEYYLAMRQTNQLLPSIADRNRLPRDHPLAVKVYNQSAERNSVHFDDNRNRESYDRRGRSPHRGYRSQTPYHRSHSRSRSRSHSRDRNRRSHSRDKRSGGARLNLHTAEREYERDERDVTPKDNTKSK